VGGIVVGWPGGVTICCVPLTKRLKLYVKTVPGDAVMVPVNWTLTGQVPLTGFGPTSDNDDAVTAASAGPHRATNATPTSIKTTSARSMMETPSDQTDASEESFCAAGSQSLPSRSEVENALAARRETQAV
jgi:hypothetical protein